MKALREIGWRKTLRYILSTLLLIGCRLTLVSPLRVTYLALFGAHIGKHVVLQDVHFFNAYRKGFPALHLADSVFIGDEALLDLADDIVLDEHVTIAERVTVLTHTNVGYADHPLQPHFPAFTKPVHLKRGAFIGANATILPGVTVGEGTFVAAGSVLTADTPDWSLVGGVPARVIRMLRPSPTPNPPGENPPAVDA